MGNGMKKSEMIDHMSEEVSSALRGRQYSNETDDKYWTRKMTDILDMQLGFGMLPPERFRDKDWNETGITYSQWIQLSGKINEWEKE